MYLHRPGRITIALLALFAGMAGAHQGHHGNDEARAQTRVLGQIHFPTSTESAPAQDAFVRGMLLLHLFEYEFARTEFRQARELDPDFVMAYWGEAMTWNHPLWDRQEREQARAVLRGLGPTAEQRAARATTPKERDFLESLEILFGEGPKAARDDAYRRHYAAMAQRYPEDDEVQLFHALAIMGVGAGVRDVPAYMEAAAIAQSAFYANRRHPGAAHYLIHAVDDPVHAPLGLEAARALAVMAPDAGHSLHMTSHIFTALGMWDDVVAANVAAAEVQNEMAAELGRTPRHWGHYNFWLLYGLLQQRRLADARALLVAAREETQARDIAPPARLQLDPDRSQIGSLVQMWARYMIETQGKDEAIARWKFDMGDAYDPRLTYHYARAASAQEAAVIGEHLVAFRELRAGVTREIKAHEAPSPTERLFLQRLAVIEEQLQALLARAEGATEKMLIHAREANRLEGEMPYSYGPPFVDLPSALLLGRLLLEEDRFDEAAAAFQVQLERSRRKPQALLGLARAEWGRGNGEAARFAMAEYERVQRHADPPETPAGTSGNRR